MNQIFHIHPDNPQPRLISQAVDTLNKGGVIVYPTDSGYALGCRLEDKNAMERICRIRQLDGSHNFTLVCRDLSELSTYARRLMNDKRKTIGLRVPSNPVALALLEALNEPMMSTSLMLPGNDFTESDPEEIQDRIGKLVDLIIDGGTLGQQPTTVVDLTSDTPEVIREGVGDSRPFR
ncbi:MAG: Sua5/YciO/YrdC/YwlC family protein [Pantoea sp.]|nr:Sua5/YciO/YrdC/YwlC family protein [Pantoea sp.]